VIKIEAFLALEASLAGRLRDAFRAYVSGTLSKIEDALDKEDYDEAVRLVGTIDLRYPFESAKGYIAWVTNLVMLFGASRVTKRPGTSVVGLGYEKMMAQQIVSSFCTVSADSGTQYLVEQALQLIAQRRKDKAQVQKDSAASYKAWVTRRRNAGLPTKETERQGYDTAAQLRALGAVAEISAEEWDSLSLPIGPQEYVETMLGGPVKLLKGGDLTLSLQSDGLSLWGSNLEVHGVPSSAYIRTLYPKSMEMHHDKWVIDKSARGTGAAKKALADSIDLYSKMGVKKLKLTANEDAGGYVWARFGFKPETPETAHYVAKEAKDKLARAARLAKPTGDALREYQLVERVVDSLVSSGVDGKEVMNTLSILSSLKTPNLDREWAPVFAAQKKAVGLNTVAKMILRNSYWAAVLDFSDASAVKRVRDYAKGI
jgi:hypothetical protein